MAINLGGISDSDLNRARDIRNPPAKDAGDNIGSGGDAGFDGMFDDLDSLFGDSGGNDAGAGAGQNDPFGGQAQGTSFGGQAQGTSFGGQQGGQFGNGLVGYAPPVQPKPDRLDKAIDFSAEAAGHIGQILLEMLKSFKSRTADDIGYLSTNLIKVGGIGLGACVIMCIIAGIVKVPFLGIHGITQQLLLGFALTCSCGMISLGVAAMAVAKAGNDSIPDIRGLSDVADEMADDSTKDYEDGLGDIMDELFGDMDDEVSLDEDTDDFSNNSESAVPVFSTAQTKIDFNKKVSEVAENRLINRRVLLDTFLGFLPTNTPDFALHRNIEEGTTVFDQISTLCLKALANVLKCEMEEVKSSVASASETFFSYEIQMQRVRGLNKTAELASELEVYFRESASDTSVNATVTIEKDYYHIIITKGVTAVVTFGDTMKLDYVKSFFESEKNKLPMITGIDELGKVIVDDAKNFDTMLIAGKPRSGKSWYVLSILMSLILFNPPEDVQFIIVDPKKSNLFKTMSLLPHVAGLHTEKEILDVMSDIIDNEAPARKKILADNRCDDIWALRKKGIKVPILYLVIDEYITVRSSLESDGNDKALDSKMQVMISQLPSLGIRLIFVPHRATGVVNKTNRTMLQYTAAVRADMDDVIDTLGIKSWKRSLTNPGDIAIKNSSMKDAIYIRGAALTPSDEENSDLIENIAKAFYKMGVDLPDMSTMEVAVNRDEDYIRERLIGTGRVQYNASSVFDDLK